MIKKQPLSCVLLEKYGIGRSANLNSRLQNWPEKSRRLIFLVAEQVGGGISVVHKILTKILYDVVGLLGLKSRLVSTTTRRNSIGKWFWENS